MASDHRGLSVLRLEKSWVNSEDWVTLEETVPLISGRLTLAKH